MTSISNFSQKLGCGKTVAINREETIFMLDSFTGNPIIKPQDLNLTWKEDDGIHTGSVFNGGAETFNDKVILAPRCQSHYKKNHLYR